MDYQTQYHEYKALADAALNTYFTDTAVSYHRLLEAMHYSLTAAVMTTSFGCIVTVSFPWGRIQKDYVEKY